MGTSRLEGWRTDTQASVHASTVTTQIKVQRTRQGGNPPGHRYAAQQSETSKPVPKLARTRGGINADQGAQMALPFVSVVRTPVPPPESAYTRSPQSRRRTESTTFMRSTCPSMNEKFALPP